MNNPTAKQIKSGCKHFTGIQNDQCAAGIAYKQFLYHNYDKFPCRVRDDGTFTGACTAFEFHTVEEIEQEEKDIAQAIAQWASNLEQGICPHCGTRIEHKRQIGRCVYADPCGCRLYQGRVDDEVQP